METVLLYDTTLRDGTQGEDINFSVQDKIRIAKKLDEFGIHYIEGGWPGSNPRDKLFFESAKRVVFKNARLAAFGSTRKPNSIAENDPNVCALLESETPVVTVFGKSWQLHVREVMNNTPEENLNMIRDTVACLKKNGREVVYDGEHFFDGYKDNREYALETLSAAFFAGADFFVLCDTNGGTLPFELESIVLDVRRYLEETSAKAGMSRPVRIGIHTHDDSGLAVANTVSAVHSGAVMVQGTINGYGERCGNADLTSIIPILELKMGKKCVSEENLKNLLNLSRFVSETANVPPNKSRPYVGRSAFAHKGGIHVSAIRKTSRAYEHIDPEKVGNRRRVLVSDLSGKSNVEYKARELGVPLGGNGHDSKKIVSRIKEMENHGYQFDAAEGSFKILLEKLTDQFAPLFSLEHFRVSIEKDLNKPCKAQATIKISVGDKEEITAAEGHGPVSALDNAIRKALYQFYPEVEDMHLVDFKVRVIDGKDGTAAKVRVLIESRDEKQIWSTIGVSEDIIEASWQALEDSFQFKLSEEKNRREQLTEGATSRYQTAKV